MQGMNIIALQFSVGCIFFMFLHIILLILLRCAKVKCPFRDIGWAMQYLYSPCVLPVHLLLSARFGLIDEGSCVIAPYCTMCCACLRLQGCT